MAPLEDIAQEMARERMMKVIHLMRARMAEAKKIGAPKIGILAVNADGSGRVVAQLDAPDFVDDLCRILGVPTTNTPEEDMDAAALKIRGMLGKEVGNG